MKDLQRAIASLNVFALYFGFPALVFAGLVGGDLALSAEPGFWLAIPLAQLLVTAAAAAIAPRSRPQDRGTLALVGLFGNIAYLGLPVCIAVFGESITGIASLAVSMHVAIAVSVGPALLAKWSGGTQLGLRLAFRQPLFWAPFVGLAARALPDASREILHAASAPLGAGAAPVALFMLGLYLYDRRDAVRSPAPRHVLLCLVISPAITLGVVLALRAAGLLNSAELAGVAVILSGMPAAVATFSISHDVGAGLERVAASVVQSTLLCLVTLAPLAALVVHLLERW
jgi:predicted permease